MPVGRWFHFGPLDAEDSLGADCGNASAAAKETASICIKPKVSNEQAETTPLQVVPELTESIVSLWAYPCEAMACLCSRKNVSNIGMKGSVLRAPLSDRLELAAARRLQIHPKI